MSAIPDAHRGLLNAYRMPAEWERHVATYLVWPHNRETWPGKFEPVPSVFARMAATIAHFEPVRILVQDEAMLDEVRTSIRNAQAPCDSPVRNDRIELLPIPTNDSWVRDYGPIFITRRRPGSDPASLALDWRFNSWGEKYGAYDLDDVAARRLAGHYDFEIVTLGIVLEGGSIDVNGAGMLLTTESCLLNKNRNPQLSRGEIEEYLRVYLGITQILWLGEGIAGDDTDGHVDDLARFTDPETIVTVVEEDVADPNHAPLRDNLARLRSMRDLAGRPFRIETLPMPPALYHEGTRLPASYANFYILNGAVLMPSFGAAADSVAQATLSRLFPDREIIAIPSVDLVWGLGAVHCLTQQHPAAA